MIVSGDAALIRLVLIVILVAWGSGIVLAIVHLRDKGLDAGLTAAYLLLWPAAAVLLYLNEPVPMWLALPAGLGLAPWLKAWPHLKAVLEDPASSRPGRLIGIPKAYWLWGGGLALLLGIVMT